MTRRLQWYTGYRLGLQIISISCTTWGVDSLATSSSFLGEVSRRGDKGGWFQQQRYISVVDMKGRSSIWQPSSGSSLHWSMSFSEPDLRVFSGVSLLRSSRWLGESGWISDFWGLSLAPFPRDFWPFGSPKHDFLCVTNKLLSFVGLNDKKTQMLNIVILMCLWNHNNGGNRCVCSSLFTFFGLCHPD